MARLSNINEYASRKEKGQQPMITPSNGTAEAASVMKQHNTLAEPVMPASQKLTPLTKEQIEQYPEAQHNNYMQSFNTWEEAQKSGKFSQQAWAKAKIDEMVAKGENPGSYLNMLSLIGDAESPEEKRKRERRAALGETFRGLGNLIGNVANLYYTHRGGQYIDLNSVHERHRERMQRLKEKQDALKQRQDELLGKAKLSDVQAERAERTAARKAKADAELDALKYKREMSKLAIQNAYKMGQIDAQTKAKLMQDAAKAKTDKELESIRQRNRISLKTTPSYGEDDIVESFADTNGVVWTRTKPFSKGEKAEFFESLPMEVQQMFTVEQYDDNGSVKSRKVDYDGALGYAINQGYITNPEERGFKKGKSTEQKSSKKTIQGFGETTKTKKKTISGF